MTVTRTTKRRQPISLKLGLLLLSVLGIYQILSTALQIERSPAVLNDYSPYGFTQTSNHRNDNNNNNNNNNKTRTSTGIVDERQTNTIATGTASSISITKNDQAESLSHSKSHFTWKNGCQVWSKLDVVTQPRPSPLTGLVVTLLLTSHDPQYQQAQRGLLCNAIPSQYTHLYEPQGWDLLLLFATDEYDAGQIATCLGATIQGPTQLWHNLDGTNITTTVHITTHGRNIFLGHTVLNYPSYIRDHPDVLLQKITPEECDAPQSYIQGTRWYSNELLHLAILQDYDYFIKMDLDMYFGRTVPIDLLHDMSVRGAIFGHTAELVTQQSCSQEIVQAVGSFVNATKKEKIRSSSSSGGGGGKEEEDTNGWSHTTCTQNAWQLTTDTDLYYTNFIMARVDFWTSPMVRKLARFLSDYPTGFFRHRWTDQVFWHHAMGLFIENFTNVVADYSEFRCSPEVNCWNAVFFVKLYTTADTISYARCDNGGAFMHIKNPTWKWNTTKSVDTLWRSDTEIYNTSYTNECFTKIQAKKKENQRMNKEQRNSKQGNHK
jgi:hypothetical protein